MLRLLAWGLQSQSHNESIKLFLCLSCYQLSQSSKSAYRAVGQGVLSYSCLPACLLVSSQEGQIGFLLLLSGSAWLMPTHRMGVYWLFSPLGPYMACAGSQQGQIGFLLLFVGPAWLLLTHRRWIGFFLLLGSLWLVPAHRKGKLTSCYSSKAQHRFHQLT